LSFFSKGKGWILDKIEGLRDWWGRPLVQIRVIDRRRVHNVNLRDLPKINVEGRVLETSRRKVIELGSSHAITQPGGWLANIENNKHVECMFILKEDKSEEIILIRKPAVRVK